MASPALESFCCMFENGTFEAERLRPPHVMKSSKDSLFAYNVLCITSSAISILGAGYQLYPKQPGRPFRSRNELRSFMRQNIIICWLAFADLMASIGIFLRSVLWISGHLPHKHAELNQNNFGNLFCAISSGWVQFFYLCTYFWTFCYAFDVYLLVNDKPSWTWTYHATSWTLSVLLSVAGLVTLYNPSVLSCERRKGHLLPHYLATYIPILFVMISNPILMVLSSKSVRSSLMQSGRYTDQERGILSGIKQKFFLITLVFYVCWLPNIVNGVLLLLRYTMSSGLLTAVWTYMAVTNPLQAFLNSLVYRGAGGCNIHLRSRLSADDFSDSRPSRRPGNHLQASQTEESTENSPLLNSRTRYSSH